MLQSPRGTQDVLPSEQPYWEWVKGAAWHTSRQLGYQPISVPSYEYTSLFQRSIGEGTDVIDKELFLVRSVQTEIGKEEYALRPEFTAGIVRAYLEHGMRTWPQPVKLTTTGSLFRYDRPQKGRFREHTQFDCEYFGEKGPFADAWVILTTWRFFQILGLENLTLQLNTLGTSEERSSYIEALRQYLQPHLSHLSEDSKHRLSVNPLRILDSKAAEDIALLEEAPKLFDFLGEESKQHFAKVQEYLTAWNIPFVHNHTLVRGLDYYVHTTFEWTSAAAGGQQSSLGGGGRYDGLLTQLGGQDAGAVGFGIGLERIIDELKRQEKEAPILPRPDVYLIAADEEGRKQATNLATTLLEAGIAVEANLDKEGVSGQLKAANRLQAGYAVIIGGDEATHGVAKIKDLGSGDQWEVPLDEIAGRILTTGGL